MRVGDAVTIAVDNARVVGRVVGIALARVQHAVEIGVLRAVFHATAITVGVERTRHRGAIVTIGDAHPRAGVGVRIVTGMARLGAVEQAIVITVRIENVDHPVAVGVGGQVGLVTVEHTVVVAVFIVGITTQEGFLRVGDAIAITVGEAGVIARVIRITFTRSDHTIEIGVFATIGNTTAVAVRHQWIGGGRAAVAIRSAGCRSWVGVGVVALIAKLGTVVQTVVVAIGVEHIDETVTIGVVGKV